MFEETDPKTLKKWLIVAAVVYFLFPFDFIPDLLGIPGRVDDLAAMGLFAWYYRGHLARFVARSSGNDAGARAAGAEQGAPASTARAAFDPHAILGVPRSASSQMIRDAYRARMQEYHPDKVAHLGVDLQKLALEKSQDIQRAYRQLRG